jgi:putative salt-induced outer membrane protein YdiY
VAINETMNLTVGLSATYNSDPGPGLETTDTLLTTGISVKFE